MQRYAIIPYRPAPKIILSPHKSHFFSFTHIQNQLFYNILINSVLLPRKNYSFQPPLHILAVRVHILGVRG